MLRIILIITVIAGLIIVSLVFLANTDRNPEFARIYNQSKSNSAEVIPIADTFPPVIEILGIYQDLIYLSTEYPGLMLKYNLKNSMGSEVISADSSSFLNGSSTDFVTVFSQNKASILRNNAGRYLRYSFTNSKSSYFALQPSAILSGVQLSSGSIVVRRFKKFAKDPIISKLSIDSSNFYDAADLLPQTGNGGMDHDGILVYDSIINACVYIEYYSNRFFLFDSNLVKIKEGKTIVPIAKPNIKFKNVSDGRYTQTVAASPLKVVSSFACADEGFLYVLSKVPERANLQRSGNIFFDIYDLHTLSYKGSFLLERIADDPLLSMKVRAGKLFLLYKSNLSVYKLS